jgi:hypothetical protein
MSTTTRLAMLVFFALMTANANAVGWGNQVSITTLQANTSGSIYLSTSGNQNPDGCGTSTYLLISDTTYKFVVATALAAQTSGQTVMLYYNGCVNGYPSITAIAVPHS